MDFAMAYSKCEGMQTEKNALEGVHFSGEHP